MYVASEQLSWKRIGPSLRAQYAFLLNTSMICGVIVKHLVPNPLKPGVCQVLLLQTISIWSWLCPRGHCLVETGNDLP